MPSYVESIVINRPVRDVFEYAVDVEREREWQSGIESAYQSPPGLQRVGTERRYRSSFMGKTLNNVYVNRVYEENRRVAFESTKESDLTASADIQFEAVSGGTKVTMALDVKLPKVVRLIPKAVLESTSRKELRESLLRLKGNLER